MKIKEIRQLNREDLDKRIREAHQELFNLRFQLATGKAKNYKRIPEVKRDVAKMMTVLRARELTSTSAE
jgi:large subunit ribosomal protein L29